MNGSVIPFVRKNFTRHPALLGAVTTATGLLRHMALKPFTPRTRRREFQLRDSVASILANRSQIFKEKGYGSTPTIVIGGFVPDATELVEFQRDVFRQYGSIYYMNYPRNGFTSELFFAQLADLIEDINNHGNKPVIFSVSFGSGLLARFLQEWMEPEKLGIKGIVMASPVLCTEDLIRPERDKSGGIRMLEINLKRILKADPSAEEDVNRQIDRARRCFKALFEAGAENRQLSGRHLTIRKKIMDVIERTSAAGGYQRVLALKGFSRPLPHRPIFNGPALTLLAEQEGDLLVPNSPTMAALRTPDTCRQLFPRGKVRVVCSGSAGDSVAHASLIFHHSHYNPIIKAWYDKLVAPVLFAVV
ncbi:alpha/beta hydrolase [Geotalea toluenoxydans]